MRFGRWKYLLADLGLTAAFFTGCGDHRAGQSTDSGRQEAVRSESDSGSSALETFADEALPDLPTHTGAETPGDTARRQDIGIDRSEDAADLSGVLSADSGQKEAPPAEPDASQLDVDHGDAPMSFLDQKDSHASPISTLDAGEDVVDTAVPHDDAGRVPDVARPPSDGSSSDTLATDAAQSCSPGAQRCNGNTIESCSATLKWLAGQTCEGATPYCRPATATCGCVPGDQRCDADGVVPEICEDGLWRRQLACSGLVSPTCSGKRCVLDDWRDRAPALVAYGQDKLGVFTALDGVDLLAKYRQAKAWTPSGFAWNPRHMPIEGSPQAVSWSDGTIQLFATQADGSIAYETFSAGDIERTWDRDGQQPHWASLSHPASTLLFGQPGIAACGPNCLDLVARGVDNGLYHRRWAGAWQPVRDWAAWGGSVASSPVVVAVDGKQLFVAAFTPSGDLWVGQADVSDANASSALTRWVYGRPGSVTFVGRPSAVARPGGRVALFARTANGRAYRASVGEAIGLTWTDLGAVSSDVAVAALRADHYRLLARLPNGQLGIKEYADGLWNPSVTDWTSLGAPASGILGQPAVATRALANGSEQLDVAVFGTDHAVYWKSWNQDHWEPSPSGFTALSSAPDPWVDLEPFWKAAQMRGEPLLLTDYGDRIPRARLLAKGSLVSLTDAARVKTYQVDADFTFDRQSKTITLPSQSTVPHATLAELTTLRDAGEGHQFHDRQIAVTYQRMESLAPALVAMNGSENLARVRSKLLQGKPVRVVVYGDSISEGYNSSGLMGTPPYYPPWPVQLARRLAAQYHSSVTLLNPSMAGTSSQWGKNHLAGLVTGLEPDLVVVAFGMNDATAAVPVSEYGRNITTIVDGIRASTSADVVLVASILPDPSCGGACLVARRPYRDVLHQVANRQGKATAWVDMLQVHQNLLGLSAPVAACEAGATCSCSGSTLTAQSQAGPKTFQDLTGNGINHPNDWLARWYAVEVGELLAP